MACREVGPSCRCWSALIIRELYDAIACLRRKGLLPKPMRKAKGKFVEVRVLAPGEPVQAVLPDPQAGCCAGCEALFQNKFTNQFNAQNFSVFIPAHSGLVLTLGATDYFLGHFFLLDAFI